jgi:hypothetical protein
MILASPQVPATAIRMVVMMDLYRLDGESGWMSTNSEAAEIHLCSFINRPISVRFKLEQGVRTSPMETQEWRPVTHRVRVEFPRTVRGKSIADTLV